MRKSLSRFFEGTWNWLKMGICLRECRRSNKQKPLSMVFWLCRFILPPSCAPFFAPVFLPASELASQTP